ncbi:MAG TPA: permease prefix domain 1-containing protein [Verrucomicrobiae bacterium]|jgi:hypothetical protein
MENQTRFDLNTAVESWRQELAAQSGLTADNRRELETHLQDAMTRLQGRGLSDEESYLIARHRIGRPRQLTEEFMKSNPAQAWRERALWTAVILLGFNLWQTICAVLSLTHFFGPHYIFVPEWVQFYFPLWLDNMLDSWQLRQIVLFILHFLPLVWLVVYATNGPLGKSRSLWNNLTASRLRVVSLTLGLVFIVHLLYAFFQKEQFPKMSAWNTFDNLIISASWPLILVAMITWLKPQRQKTV